MTSKTELNNLINRVNVLEAAGVPSEALTAFRTRLVAFETQFTTQLRLTDPIGFDATAGRIAILESSWVLARSSYQSSTILSSVLSSESSLAISAANLLLAMPDAVVNTLLAPDENASMAVRIEQVARAVTHNALTVRLQGLLVDLGDSGAISAIIDQVHQEIEELRHELSQVSAEIAAAIAQANLELQGVRADLAATRAELLAALQQANDDISDARGDLDQTHADLEQVQIVLHAEVVAAEAEIAQARIDLAAVDAQLGAAITAAEGELADARAEIVASQAEALAAVAAAKTELSGALAENATVVAANKAAADAAFSDLQSAIEAGGPVVETLSQTVAGNTAAISSESVARAQADLAIAGRIDAVEANVGANTAAILSETVARADQTSALAARIDSLVAESGQQRVFAQPGQPASAEIGDLWIDTDDGNHIRYWDGASWVDVTDSRLIGAIAAISSESIARTTADEAFVAQINELFATTGDNTAAISSEASARASADAALATRLDLVEAATNDGQHVFAQSTPPSDPAVGDLWIDIAADNIIHYWDGSAWIPYADNRVAGAVAAIAAETTARTTADSALADRIDALTATVGGNTASINDESIARADGDSALASQISTVSASATRVRVFRQPSQPVAVGVGDAWYDTDDGNKLYIWDGDSWELTTDAQIAANTASISSEAVTRATADSALGVRIDTLTTTVDGNTAAISSESTARSDADSALASQITTVSAAADRVRVFRQSTTPTAGGIGDIWYDTGHENATFVWSGSSWDPTDNTQIAANAAAITSESIARADADTSLASQITTVSSQATRVRVFRQAAAPTAGGQGDIWFDTDDGNKTYVWSGAAWVATDNVQIALNTAAISTETIARTDADSALASQITTLTSTVDGNASAISQEAITRADQDTALGALISSLTTTVAGNTAAISTESQARSDADSALAGQITTVSASAARVRVFRQPDAPTAGGVGDVWVDTDDQNKMYIWSGGAWVLSDNTQIATNTAAISTEAIARADQDTALASLITALTSRVGDNEAAISAESITRADDDSALASQITTVSASAARVRVFRQPSQPTAGGVGDVWYDTDDGNKSYVWDGAVWQSVENAQIATNTAAIVSEASVRTTADTALGSRIDSLTVTVDGNTSAISTEATARADGDAALAGTISTVSSVASRQRVFRQDDPPTAGGVGDIWYDTNDQNKTYVWSGTAWLATNNPQIDANTAAIVTEATTRADQDTALAGLITTLTSHVDDNTAAISSEAITRANADSALSSRIDNVVASSGAPQRVWAQRSTPTPYGVGDVWIDTSNSNRIKFWDGAAWVDYTDARLVGAIAAISDEQTARTTADSAFASDIASLFTITGGNTTSITSETLARTTADTALGTRIDNLTTTVGGNTTSISNEITARTTSDTALGGRIDSLSTVVDGNTTAISNESLARSDADTALAGTISTVSAQATRQRAFRQPSPPTAGGVGDIWYDSDDQNKVYIWSGSAWVLADNAQIAINTAAISTETTARADADTALTALVTTLRTDVDGNTAAIVSEAATRSTADSAMGTLITGLRTDVDGNAVAISSESTARSNADSALGGRIDSLTTVVGGNTAAISAESLARSDADTSLATSISTVSASAARQRVFRQTSAPTAGGVGDVWVDTDDQNKMYIWSGSSWVLSDNTQIAANTASISAESTARADADSALGLRIDTVEASVGTNSASITTEQLARVTADNDIYAKYAVKVDVNGYVSGFGLISTANNATPTSTFTILADNFLVAKPGAAGGAATTVFELNTVNGSPKLTLKGDFIADGSISGQHISVTAALPATVTVAGTGTSLSAITLNSTYGSNAWSKFSGAGNTLPSGNVEFNFASSASKGGNALNVDAVGTQPASTVQNSVINFNANNDRFSTTPNTPGLGATPVAYTQNTDGSVDLSFQWSFTTSATNDANNIDGFMVVVRPSTTAGPYTFGSSPAQETLYYVTPDRRAVILTGVAANNYYTFGVQAYRIVDSDINAAGLIKGAMAAASVFQPMANVAFAGNITGTINGTSAATVVSNAANGASAWGKFSGAGNTIPSGNVEFNFATSASKGGNATNVDAVGTQPASTVQSAVINFNGNNDRNAVTPTAPTAGAVAHTLNTDSSANVSFQWSFTNATSGGGDIDGFIVIVYASTSSAAYSFGTTPAAEQVYYVTPDRRALILTALAANLYYTFGVQAYRVVDSDINSSGFLKSSVAAAAAYRPTSSVAFAGDITGTINGASAATVVANASNGALAWGKFTGAGNTLPQGNVEFNFAASTSKGGNATNVDAVGTQPASTVQNAVINFNSNNDRNATPPTAPGIAGSGNIAHTINTDGSAEISFKWTFTNTTSGGGDIDGFVLFVRAATSSSGYAFGTTPAQEQVYYLTPDRRAFVFSAAAANLYYTFGVLAYRIVDSDINSAGVLKSAIIQSAVTGENPYQPAASVAFAGDITGTLSGTSVATVVSNASLGAQDPATRINAAATTIDPGKILISGSTTLASWRNGSDNTKIDGGNIAANTISANKISIGNRNLAVTGIEFSWSGNTLSWTAGAIGYVNDAGANVTVAISSGGVLWTSGTVYVAWAKDATSLSSGTSQFADSAYVTLATYQGGSNLVANYGRTLIDGAKIVTGSVTADKITASSLSSISANIGTVTAGLIQSANGKMIIDLNNNRIIISDDS